MHLYFEDRWSIYEKPKFDNKPKTRKRKILGWASWASWCACACVKCDQSMKTERSTTNPKLENKLKTREQKIVGGASSIMMYVWNFGMWSIYENPKLDNNPNTWKQTQKSEIKNRAVSVEHRGVCVCGMLQCDQSMKTQDLTTNPKLENEKSWGERRVSWCVCVCGMLRCDQSMKTQNSTTNHPGLF